MNIIAKLSSSIPTTNPQKDIAQNEDIDHLKGAHAGKRYREVWGAADMRTDQPGQRDDGGRKGTAQEVSNGLYNLVTDNYIAGWSTRFHYCPFEPREAWATAMARHEHYLALVTGMRPGMRVLDAGCGVGAPAREVAVFTRAHVTGVTLNAYHRALAERTAREEGVWGEGGGFVVDGDDDGGDEKGTTTTTRKWVFHDDVVAGELRGKTQFVEGDFTKLPFDDGSFDAVYAMEATCHARPVAAAYREIFRVLKPGGRFGTYEWCMTDTYDEGVAEHRRIRNCIERGGGVTYLNTERECEEALEEVGFVVEVKDNGIAERSRVPWWYPMAGDLSHATHTSWADWMRVFLMKTPVVNATSFFLNIAHKLGLVADEDIEALETCKQCAWGNRDGGITGIFTPFMLFVGRKPEVRQ